MSFPDSIFIPILRESSEPCPEPGLPRLDGSPGPPPPPLNMSGGMSPLELDDEERKSSQLLFGSGPALDDVVAELGAISRTLT